MVSRLAPLWLLGVLIVVGCGSGPSATTGAADAGAALADTANAQHDVGEAAVDATDGAAPAEAPSDVMSVLDATWDVEPPADVPTSVDVQVPDDVAPADALDTSLDAAPVSDDVTADAAAPDVAVADAGVEDAQTDALVDAATGKNGDGATGVDVTKAVDAEVGPEVGIDPAIDVSPIDLLGDPTAATGWVDPCFVQPTPAWGSTVAPLMGYPVLGNGCALTGWVSPPSPTPLSWTDITADLNLPGIGQISHPVILHDFNGDEIADLVFLVAPSAMTEPTHLMFCAGPLPSGLQCQSSDIAGVLPDDAAVWDVDGDGLDDILFVGGAGATWVRNTGGAFQTSPPGWQVSSVYGVPHAHTVALLDANRDAHRDIYMGRTGLAGLVGAIDCAMSAPSYMECCIGSFAPGCLQSLADPNQPFLCCDTAVPPMPNVLVWGTNAGGWNTGLNAAGADDEGATLSVQAYDVDRDGWPDLFAGNDFGESRWYRNVGGTFDKSPANGLRPYGHAMGSSIVDFDHDLWPELAVSNIGSLILYRGQSDGTWADAGPSGQLWSASESAVTWGQRLLDADQDGWEDLVVATSAIGKPGQLQAVSSGVSSAAAPGHHLALHNQGAGFVGSELPWTATSMTGIVNASAASADMDGDGDVDVAFIAPSGQLQVFRNDTPQGHGLRIRLFDMGGRTPEGAWVQVWAQGHLQERYVSSSTGYGSHGESLVRIGLGTVTTVDAIRIWWPSGRVSLLGPLPADQTVDFQEFAALQKP